MIGKFLQKRAAAELIAATEARNTLKAGPVEQARVAAGHMLGRAAGGAIIGAGVNGYEYSQTGTGLGGAFSMGESLVTGAAAGAIAGAVIGGLGARAAAKKVTASASKAQARYNKATVNAIKRGVVQPFPDATSRQIIQPAVGGGNSKATSTMTHTVNAPIETARAPAARQKVVSPGPFPPSNIQRNINASRLHNAQRDAGTGTYVPNAGTKPRIRLGYYREPTKPNVYTFAD